ncbi:MAG: pyridoxal-phosphate dependent enzyme [Vallitaleaceae bacterium]|jgi:cysteine synthase A|nr:pyridoxal-phosphate dependent enzyme [Vallitaleaceae bacterium]
MKIPYGPTYNEMLHPETLDNELKALVNKAKDEELDALNLFNITWKDDHGKVRKIVLPKELTGVEANIVVMLGMYFPSGSHKVGPAYSTLIEGCVDKEIIPGKHTILGPSTGNFGIGVSYICNLMGYEAIVIMPDNMSKERYERIRRYGATLDLTPGTESDVILTLERTYELMKEKNNKALAQFELMPNYRFHRHVTGNSAIEAVKGIGNGRIAAFTSALGSSGTIAAGDQIKVAFPEAKVVALEPYECATLTDGGRGQHRIEGIGDKMCTLIHNVINTDFVVMIEDDDCVKGLKVIQDGTDVLVESGMDESVAKSLVGLFGVSGICNILGAIKMAKYLKLGADDNVVTVATDGFDRYDSVLEDLDARCLETSPHVLERWKRDIFDQACTNHITDFRSSVMKEQLFNQKEKDWIPFGYKKEYLDSMKVQGFWDHEYEKIEYYNEKIKRLRNQEV